MNIPDTALHAGFKTGTNGPHISRTLMLTEVSRCLDSLSSDASLDDARAAIEEKLKEGPVIV